MALSKVWIVEGCISCSICEDTCPEVFELGDVATVKEGVDYRAYADKIKKAADNCPVEVIRYE